MVKKNIQLMRERQSFLNAQWTRLTQLRASGLEMKKITIDPASVASLDSRRFNNVIGGIVSQSSVTASACKQVLTVASHLNRNNQRTFSDFDYNKQQQLIDQVLSLPKQTGVPHEVLHTVPSSSSSRGDKQVPITSIFQQVGSLRNQKATPGSRDSHGEVTTSGERILTLLQDQKVLFMQSVSFFSVELGALVLQY